MKRSFHARALLGAFSAAVATATVAIVAAPAAAHTGWVTTNALANFNVTVGPGATFAPTPTTITVGDTVTWTWAGGFHSSTFGPVAGVSTACGTGSCGTCSAGACADTWDSGIKTVPDTFSHTFTSTGTYQYYCYPHYLTPHTGQIVVQAAVAVTFQSFSAARSRGGVVVRWKTASESGMLGFNVWRSGSGATSKVNRALVPTKGTVAGAAYRITDRSARRNQTYTYKLEAVNQDGSRRWYGRALVNAIR